MKHLVTGGAGFIGSAIVRALLAEGAQVRVADNFSTGKRGNLTGLTAVEVLEGDLCDPAFAATACRGVEVVFHQAALPSVPHSVAEPWFTHGQNFDATLQVLLAARQAGVRRVIYAASAAAYGDDPALPKSEAMPVKPLSPYAADKLAGEYYAAIFASLYGLETISLRYFNVYGPRQDPASPYSGVISCFLAALTQAKTPVIYGDGLQTRDFVNVSDVARANLLARDHGQSGRVYNIATGRRTSLLEVLRVLGDELGAVPAPQFREARAGDIRDSVADISAAARDLIFVPQVSLAQGLREALA